MIYLYDNILIEVYFLFDYVIYDCIMVEDLVLENFFVFFDWLEILYEDCELIVINYEDWVFIVVFEFCVKILCEWWVIDWCIYEYGGSIGIWSEI